MANLSNIRKMQHEVKRLTSHIRPDPRTSAELAERDHLHELYLRLIPFAYDYPTVPLPEIVRAVPLRLTAAESQYLLDRLTLVRRKQNVVVVSREDEDVLLPLRPGFDPRRLPLAAIWTDGGYYSPKERAQSNSGKLRKLGLPDNIAGYVSYRVLILNPSVSRPGWLEEPQEVAVKSSYEAEAVAVELALTSLINRLESESRLPPADQFHAVIFSDCQSLIEALKAPPQIQEAAAPALARIRNLAGLLAAIHPQWEMRRRIKQRLGH